MRWTKRLSENVKRGIRSWLNVQEASPANILINEPLDYEANAIKNRIWYRGDSEELQQLYSQIDTGVDKYKFWACKSTPGQEIRKIHTGLPALVVDTLAGITLADLDIQIEKDREAQEAWKQINKDNKFRKKLEKAVKETLYIGDGAFKISFDIQLSQYPIVEFYPGDRIELVTERGRIKEIVFKTAYRHDRRDYVLYEHYGYGMITYELYRGETQVSLKSIPQTENLVDVAFGTDKPEGKYMMAVPIQFYESGKWDERGQSIFDKKIDSYDAFDEVWSQWMDAVRMGRAKEYIPDCLIPRNPETGELMRPNHFDNRFIAVGNDMSENAKNMIDVEQPNIPHESYLASYCTALDLCLQGLISPSTLGIDVKKLDNSEAQREKEKTTLYTRNTIINALQVDIPLLVETVLKAYNEFYRFPVKPVEVTIEFGDYANPSFESQIETISKARQGQIMSVDAAVDELYGDDKDDTWKQEEIKRLKEELGIGEVEEPGVNLEAGGFKVNTGGSHEGKGSKQNIQNEPEGVPGASSDSKGTGSKGSVRSGKR
jgi:A118 family predicted phage portal protein|nr:MAG TPA: portal protein [Caudoviricetes sp.]